LQRGYTFAAWEQELPGLFQSFPSSLYETDSHQWAQQQARLLRAGRFGDVANAPE